MLQAEMHFVLDGAPVSCAPYGNGHINETYLLTTDRAHDYILQKINDRIFTNVPALMRNIQAVTEHIARKDADARHTLRLVQADDGACVYRDETGWYRVYEFITDSLCLEKAESEADFAQSAAAFGRFACQLADFPAQTLYEVLPRFHDTPARLEALTQAIKSDAVGRAKDVAAEIDFALSRREKAGELLSLQKCGSLPTRVTHNDTKLNNVMLDARTRNALCVIDLDTVMPGLTAYDFGDAIRFGASTAAEDERDLSKVTLSLPLYRAYLHSYLSACGDSLTKTETDTLPLGAWTMTFECGVRFLTDYLCGDTYFRIHCPEHNLLRCRTQFKLASEMERLWGDMTNGRGA